MAGRYEALKPCPFCGSSNLYIGELDGTLEDGMTIYIRCLDCGATIEGEGAHPDQTIRTQAAMADAVEKWNARTEKEGVEDVQKS